MYHKATHAKRKCFILTLAHKPSGDILQIFYNHLFPWNCKINKNLRLFCKASLTKQRSQWRITEGSAEWMVHTTWEMDSLFRIKCCSFLQPWHFQIDWHGAMGSCHYRLFDWFLANIVSSEDVCTVLQCCVYFWHPAGVCCIGLQTNSPLGSSHHCFSCGHPHHTPVVPMLLHFYHCCLSYGYQPSVPLVSSNRCLLRWHSHPCAIVALLLVVFCWNQPTMLFR